MKKFSKLLALGMALSLAFGVTAFAADSPTVETAALGKVTVGTKDGQEVIVDTPDDAEQDAMLDEMNSQEGLADEVIAAAKLTGNHTLTTVAWFDIELKGEASENGVITVTFTGTYLPNMRYVVLHRTEDGKWEVRPTRMVNGVLEADFDSLSPVVIIEVGEEVAEQKPAQPSDDNNGGNSSNDDPATSPATGETLPVAGIMALICLAGAAVCASKVRYNKQ